MLISILQIMICYVGLVVVRDARVYNFTCSGYLDLNLRALKYMGHSSNSWSGAAYLDSDKAYSLTFNVTTASSAHVYARWRNYVVRCVVD